MAEESPGETRVLAALVPSRDSGHRGVTASLADWDASFRPGLSPAKISDQY